MDLSQQELPLTSYFTSKSRVDTRKRNKLTEEDSSSVARPSKRTKNVRPSVLQGLPTPATSVRKRTPGACSKKLPQLGPTHVLSPEERTATPSPLPRSPCPRSASLATPADLRKTTNLIERKSPSNHTDTGIVTPPMSSRRVSESMHGIDCPLSAPSGHPSPSKQNHAPRDGVSVLPLNRTGTQPSKGLPMFPISSSQSQYLLPIDATPKRKQRRQHMEDVISSQSQEEREISLSSSLRPITRFGLSIDHTPRKTGNTQTVYPSPSRRNSQHARTLGCSPVRSPTNTPSRSSRFFEKKANELSSGSLGSPRGKESIPYRSPSCKTRCPRRITHQDSIENIPPVHFDDSLTESESGPDIAQASRRLPASLDACSPMCQEDNLPIVEDDSATEAESDTEILRCVAEIGKKRRPEISREESLAAPVISPLVSPARSRIAPMPVQFSVRRGAESDISGTPAFSQPTGTRSDPLPSVVRDFIRMFPGDESYPADFPASLRV